MGVFDDLKKMADKNDDGKLNKEDLDAYMGDGSDATHDVIEALKEKADTNDDGKVNLSDLKSLKELFSDK